MEINWKIVCKSVGYISLSKTISDEWNKCNGRGREGDSRYKPLFNWVIARATHYAYHQNRTLQDILNEWEEGRNYSFLNYYSENNFPRLNKSISLKPQGVRGTIKYYATAVYYKNDPIHKSRAIKDFIIRQQEKNNKKKEKPRWSMEYKRHYVRQQAYQKNL